MATDFFEVRDAETGKLTRYPSVFEPPLLLLNIVLAIVGAIIGVQLITTLGIAANTSVIGALVAMLVGRIPFTALLRFRSIHRQNLLQTSISGATFGAANALLLPIAVPFVLGRPDLVWPLLAGATVGLVVDAYVLYRTFDSRLLPGRGIWPPGVAAAETIIAGDEGGRKAWLLAAGGAVGIVGSLVGIPMSAAGVAFIGNIWALSMFGVGLLIRGYSIPLTGFDIDAAYIPHGFMIGAGLVALVQIVLALRRRARDKEEAAEEAVGVGRVSAGPPPTTDDAALGRGLRTGFLLFLAGAVLLAVVSGIWTDMSPVMLVGWVLFAATAAIVTELIVGLAAMHSGWFPAFAVALISLVLGILAGFPPIALAMLVGYTASTGPAFADMGYDLKAGWMLRRDDAASVAVEREGRRQQFHAELIGFAVALGVVAIAWGAYFEQDLVPPVTRVYGATIEAGVDPGIAMNLVLWAIPGAVIQWLGGQSRQMGILLATGLLIEFPEAGWAVLVALAIRIAILRIKGQDAETAISILGAGFIAGDALYQFGQIVTTR